MNLQTTEQRTIRQQRDRIDYLEEEVRQLRREKVPQLVFPAEWKLRPAGRKLLAAMYAAPGGLLTREQIFEIACVRSKGEDLSNLTSAHIFQIRRTLPDSIEIQAVHGLGYRLSPASKATLKSILAAQGAGA